MVVCLSGFCGFNVGVVDEYRGNDFVCVVIYCLWMVVNFVLCYLFKCKDVLLGNVSVSFFFDV